MEKGLPDAVLKMYHNASGNTHFSVADICDAFSHVVIDKPLMQSSRIAGKVASRRHILENELHEKNIEELLAEV